LDTEEVGNNTAHDQSDTGEIHLTKLLEEGSLLRDGMLGGLEEEEDDAGRDTSDGKVDVEAPSPADVVGEGTAQEGTDDTGETVGGTDDAGEGRAVLGGSGEGDDGVGSRTETCCAETGDSTAGNEGFGGGGGATDDGAELEDEDGDEEGCLQGEVLVDFTPFFSGVSILGCVDWWSGSHLHVDWKAPTVMKKAAPYQPALSRPLNSSVILGMAVATMVLSGVSHVIEVQWV
jgi:hypothetical protein